MPSGGITNYERRRRRILSDNEDSEMITSEEETDKQFFETETKEGEEEEEDQDELDQLGKASEEEVLAAMSLADQEKKFSLPTLEELEQVLFLWDAAGAHEESEDAREALNAIIGAGQFQSPFHHPLQRTLIQSA